MTIRHFDFSFFLVFNHGDFYYLGYLKINNNNNNVAGVFYEPLPLRNAVENRTGHRRKLLLGPGAQAPPLL